LSKLLIEAWLLAAALGTRELDRLMDADALDMQQNVEQWLASHPNVASLIATIGIGVLRDEGGKPTLTRGPRLNIPVPSPDGAPIPLDAQAIERWAYLGWVDLRLSNFTQWRERIMRVAAARPDIVAEGSAAWDAGKYMPRDFVPGDVVGWILTSETDEIGLPGRRVL
jgi:hypothetical protein